MATPTVDPLIKFLRAFQKRKGMYVYPVDAWAVQNFLHGFEAGCLALGFEFDRELKFTVAESHGWKRGSEVFVRQMEAKGLSEAEMMDELIEIEIDALREQGKQAAQSDAGAERAHPAE